MSPFNNRLLNDSINSSSIEARFDMDPFYERIRREFDEVALKELLLNRLKVALKIFRSGTIWAFTCMLGPIPRQNTRVTCY